MLVGFIFCVALQLQNEGSIFKHMSYILARGKIGVCAAYPVETQLKKVCALPIFYTNTFFALNQGLCSPVWSAPCGSPGQSLYQK